MAPAEAGLIQQPDVMGGHPHHHSGLRQQAHDLGRIEARQEDRRRGAQERAMQGDEQAVGMEHGQDVQQQVVVLPSPAGEQGPGIGFQAGMGQHRALGPAGGARSVEDGCKIAAGAGRVRPVRRGRGHRFGEGSLAIRPQGQCLRPAAGGWWLAIAAVWARPDRSPFHRRLAKPLASVPDENPGRRILQKIGELGLGAGPVQGDMDASGFQGSQIEGQCLRAFIHLGEHPVAGFQPQAAQRLRRPASRIQQGTEGPGGAARQAQAFPLRRAPEGGGEAGPEIAGSAHCAMFRAKR